MNSKKHIKKVERSKIIGAFGISQPPLLVGQALEALGLTYVIVGKRRLKVVEGAGKSQPAIPVLFASVEQALKYDPVTGNQIMIICDAMAKLGNCNIKTYQLWELKSALQGATSKPYTQEFKLLYKDLTVDQYVNIATKPSFLNFIQTAIYKISNYPLRKEVQGMVVQYLNSDIGIEKLKAKLKSNLKLQDLLTLVLDPKASHLRSAVTAFKKGQSLESVANEFGFDTFEILYVVNSAKRKKEEEAK